MEERVFLREFQRGFQAIEARVHPFTAMLFSEENRNTRLGSEVN